MPSHADLQESEIGYKQLISIGKCGSKSGQGFWLESIVLHCHISEAEQM